jgi:hypothetical protein
MGTATMGGDEPFTAEEKTMLSGEDTDKTETGETSPAENRIVDIDRVNDRVQSQEENGDDIETR